VHGLRGDTSIAERARFDNYYIENWSLGLDLRIIFMTVGQSCGAPALIARRRAVAPGHLERGPGRHAASLCRSRWCRAQVVLVVAAVRPRDGAHHDGEEHAHAQPGQRRPQSPVHGSHVGM
jgi:hypothetical protein